jgi:hypothetical protein
VCSETQGLEIPAEELDKTFSYKKHHVCIIHTTVKSLYIK